MDFLTVAGLILASAAVLLGQFLEGGHMSSLVNGPAILIVLGGTIGAVLVENSWSSFLKSLKLLPWIFFPPPKNNEANVEKIVSWSNVARKQGLLGLETVIENEHDDFIRSGLQLLVDGGEPNSIRKVLEVDLENRTSRELKGAKVYESMGGYSPTIGIIGAVMGLIHVMGNLSDPSKLGSGIAVAFVATIYGVGLANIVFLPVANKLTYLIHEKEKIFQMIIEGIISISEGENPRVMRCKLQGFV